MSTPSPGPRREHEQIRANLRRHQAGGRNSFPAKFDSFSSSELMTSVRCRRWMKEGETREEKGENKDCVAAGGCGKLDKNGFDVGRDMKSI